MIYVPAEKSNDGVVKVIYTYKDRKTKKIFNALDWLARLVTHIPGRYEYTVRYYGYFSNKSRGMRKKADADDTISTIMPNDMSSSEARQNWARLIQKIYEVDPLVCPKCQGQMKIISIIDDFEIIDKILKHLNLWDIRNHDPPEILIRQSNSRLCISNFWVSKISFNSARQFLKLSQMGYGFLF